MQSVQMPVIPIVGEMVKMHPGTISLGQGVVHYGPPASVRPRLEEFLADPENHKYKAVGGIPPLLDALTRKLEKENGIQLEPHSRLLVTAGGNMAFNNAVLAIADPGDEIILPVPYYFNHDMAVRMASCRSVFVPTDENYQLLPAEIERAITSRTRAVVTVSPNNPSGAVYPEAALREVNALCEHYGIYHIHDEAYEYFTYDGARHFSPASIAGADRHTISLFSLSKSYGFASWRIGYMVIPERLYLSVKKIQDTILICPPVVSQFAALGALDAGAAYCREKLGGIQRVRDRMIGRLHSLEDICTLPQTSGAFYFFVRVHTDARPMEVVERLIKEYGVAVMPGDAFGMEGACTLRIAYGALEWSSATEGIERLVNGLRGVASA